MRDAAIATQMIDNERVTVTRYDFSPGAETGWHTHQSDYVITTLTDCTLLLEHPDGKTTRSFIDAGTAYQRAKGTHHNVINDGDELMSFIEIELK